MEEKTARSDKRLIAQRLKEFRRKVGYTQEQFAEILDISLSAYKKIESGEHYISATALDKLNQKFHVSADYLLLGTDSKMEETWELLQNCSEVDKFRIFVRMMHYFTEIKDVSYMEKQQAEACDRMAEKIFEGLQGISRKDIDK